MKGHRMSSLPIARHCAKGPVLSNMGAGAAAAQSTAFHALCADDPKGKALFARLTEEQQTEMLTWRKPTDVELDIHGKQVVLKYVDAEKELEVGLNSSGSYCEASDPDCVSVGHLDFAWVIEEGGQRIAIIGDLKRSEFTASIDSLQLTAYLLAYSDKHNCELGFAGLWSLMDGTWQFGPMVDLSVFSDEREKLAERVVASALNVGDDYSMGDHCNGCYGRMRCPAYLMPPEHAETSLAPFTVDGALTGDAIANALELATRAKATAEKVIADCKAAVYAGTKVVKDGKAWKPVKSKGRASLDAKALEHDMPEVVQKYTKIGAAFDTFRWVKA